MVICENRDEWYTNQSSIFYLEKMFSTTAQQAVISLRTACNKFAVRIEARAQACTFYL